MFFPINIKIIFIDHGRAEANSTVGGPIKHLAWCQMYPDAIWREWNAIGESSFSILSPEFLHASIDELSQIEPNVSLENLWLLNDSGYWRNDKFVLSFIFEHYVKINVLRNKFGSNNFWLELFDGDQNGLMQFGADPNIRELYRMGEMYHTHVWRFNNEARAYDLEFLNFDAQNRRPWTFYQRLTASLLPTSYKFQ